MIRCERPDGWRLVTHPEHARIAAELAGAWGNDQFAPPEPLTSILYAVEHHDDGWIDRDAAPYLTADGKPEAFSRTLVGTYAAFENIDLRAYLAVRAAATEVVAAVDPLAAVLVSMHTVNLLTEQADLATIRPEHRPLHAEFVAHQRAWQEATAQRLGVPADLRQRGFEFLQACDNLSLIVCSGYTEPRDLRHTHPDRSGRRRTIRATCARPGAWELDPWPFRQRTITLTIAGRHVSTSACADGIDAFRSAYRAAPVEIGTATVTAG